MIQFENITVTFPSPTGDITVLKNASACFPRGKIIALVGPSGSGKTTCLQLLSGLLSPSAGNITRTSDAMGNVTHETAQPLSYLFQDLALLPWLTALENVNLVLSDGKETLDIARRWLQQVELTEAAARYPEELSGGMKQRVALARALSTDAELLLLDEPFRGLDATLHEKMRALVAAARAEKTTVFITHDESDLVIADLVLRVEGGAITKV